MLLLAATTAPAQTAYYWRGTSGANFTTSTSWNTLSSGAGTNRVSSQPTDVLIFDGGTPVVTMNSGQTIGRLKFINNTSVTLNSSSDVTNTITINGDATDDDLIVESGATVALTAVGTSAGTAGVVLSLGAGATGRVAGTILLTNAATTPPASADKLVSATTNSLRFITGGQLTIYGTVKSTAFSGVPVFEAGSTLEQNAANSPDHSNLAVYQSGSTFRFISGTFGTGTGSSTINRTFGNLEYASASFSILDGAMNTTIFNNLSVIGPGTLSLNARGNTVSPTGTLIGGNISVGSGVTLNFFPAGGAPNVPRVTFNGTMPQTISNAGTIAFGTIAKLEINNPAGVTLQNDLTIANDLLLTNGLLTTGAAGTGLLTMSSPMAAAAGNATSFVNGPLARQTATGNATLVFPIGKIGTDGSNKFRPISLALSNQTNTPTYTAQQTEASAVPFGVAAPLDHVSNRRYFTVAAAPAPAGSTFSASITLKFDLDDYVNNPTAASLVVAKRDGGQWTTIGSTNTGADTPNGALSAGTLTSNGFNSFSDFSLASLKPSVGFSGLNPLPVELTRFEAVAKGPGVALAWATASEKNSAYFDVQRSATGEGYVTIGRVAAQGSSTSLRTYEFVDAHPLVGMAYYRLRQLDVDGTTTYSLATSVRARDEFAIYPNPTTNDVRLPTNLGSVRYRVLNGLGQTLTSGYATGGERLDLSMLPKGTLFLELIGATGRHIQRLIRE